MLPGAKKREEWYELENAIYILRMPWGVNKTVGCLSVALKDIFSKPLQMPRLTEQGDIWGQYIHAAKKFRIVFIDVFCMDWIRNLSFTDPNNLPGPRVTVPRVPKSIYQEVHTSTHTYAHISQWLLMNSLSLHLQKYKYKYSGRVEERLM